MSENIEPDLIPVDENDPHKADHILIHELQHGITKLKEKDNAAENWLVGKLLALPANRRIDLIEITLFRSQYLRSNLTNLTPEQVRSVYRTLGSMTRVIDILLADIIAETEDDKLRLVNLAIANYSKEYGEGFPLRGIIAFLIRFEPPFPNTQEWRTALSQLRQDLGGDYAANSPSIYHYCSNQALHRLSELLGQRIENFLERGDAWADRAISDLENMSHSDRALWLALFDHARDSQDSKPKTKWLKTADTHLQLIGKTAFLSHVREWFPLYGKAADGYWFADREERNDAYFKGLVWLCSRIEDTAVVSPLGAAQRGAFKTRGRAGVRSQKVGNACIWALGLRDESEAAAHLVNAKMKIKNGTVLKTLTKTIEAVAARAQLTVDDLEEMSVPDFGLENGFIECEFDNVQLRIEIVGNRANWQWTKDGKAVKSVPTHVKQEFAPELKELKTTVAELEKTLTAQKERLDNLLRIEKTWDFATWQQRYLQHPLMQLVTQRLIWNFKSGEETHSALPQNGSFIGNDGRKLTIDENAEVSLYHPLFDSTQNILQWRAFIEENSIKQPFKQAHREIYLLTDAERNTRTYSNRFASHIVKQHQFNSLCAARRWKNQLHLMVDDDYPPPTKLWPKHNIRAEYWVEGIGEDYGTDTTEAGSYLRLTTDQVRFYRIADSENRVHAGGGGYSVGYNQQPAEPLPLEEIPPLVFSETMRDVDLFVGVSSLGADPNWSDGGTEGRFREYWGQYAWGELNESANSRADVLSRLLPRLKFKDKARIDGRFLWVEGKKRTYKIHLGSGNILMEPNDQYLCIVPKPSETTDVFLPFEGDRTLAVILSKAFLLFEDEKIKDASILHQIEN